MSNIVAQIEEKVRKPQPIRKYTDKDLQIEINQLQGLQKALEPKKPSTEKSADASSSEILAEASAPKAEEATPVEVPEELKKLLKLRLSLCVGEQQARTRRSKAVEEKGKRRAA